MTIPATSDRARQAVLRAARYPAHSPYADYGYWLRHNTEQAMTKQTEAKPVTIKVTVPARHAWFAHSLSRDAVMREMLDWYASAYGLFEPPPREAIESMRRQFQPQRGLFEETDL